MAAVRPGSMRQGLRSSGARPSLTSSLGATTTMANLDLPEIRANRTLPRGARFYKKMPSEYATDEENVTFGLGSSIAAGAGSFLLSQNVPRSCILRDLVINSTASNGRLTGITINGKAHLIGASVPLSQFSPTNTKRPEFQVWVEGGTVVTLNVTVDGAGTVDAAFSID